MSKIGTGAANFATNSMGAAAVATNVSTGVGAIVNAATAGAEANANKINGAIKEAGYIHIPEFK